MRTVRKDRNDFVQVTRGYIIEMRALATKSPLAHSLLWVLIERMSKLNAIVISQTALSEILGSPRGSISRAISILREHQWLQVIKIGTSNAYVVNSDVVWSQSNKKTGVRHTVFNALVIATETDQSEQEMKAWKDMELKNVPVISQSETPIQGNEDLPPPDQKEIDTGLSDIPLIKK